VAKYIKKTDKQTKPEGKAAVIGSDDLEKLFDIDNGFQSIRDRALFGICRFSACRINEACQLRSEDVFLPNGKLRCTHKSTQSGFPSEEDRLKAPQPMN